MREIAYRAYLKNEKQIVDVLDISFLQETIGYMNKADTKYTCAKFNDIELLPYTGLEDKNDKKIFEGDIMSISPISPKYEIKWDNEQQRFCFWNDGWIAGFNSFITSYEVIGNIYDNPELLEVEK